MDIHKTNKTMSMKKSAMIFGLAAMAMSDFTNAYSGLPELKSIGSSASRKPALSKNKKKSRAKNKASKKSRRANR